MRPTHLLLACATLLSACGGGASTPSGSSSAKASSSAAPSAATSKVPSAQPASSEDAADSDVIKPVYPIENTPSLPAAAKLCNALYSLPQQRQESCCPGAPSSSTGSFEKQCERTLTYALGHQSLSLATADVEACEKAMTEATSGCDWIAGFETPLPESCDGILHGLVAEHAQCRSSLECTGTLECKGLSAIKIGTCEAAKSDRAKCNGAVDTLAALTRQNSTPRLHPECNGFCDRRACAPLIPAGGDCKEDKSCGSGAQCQDGKCVAKPKRGEACKNACASGAACIDGKCGDPRSEGAECSKDSECRGTCHLQGSETKGKCEKTCPALPSFPSAPPPSTAPHGVPGIIPSSGR